MPAVCDCTFSTSAAVVGSRIRRWFCNASVAKRSRVTSKSSRPSPSPMPDLHTRCFSSVIFIHNAYVAWDGDLYIFRFPMATNLPRLHPREKARRSQFHRTLSRGLAKTLCLQSRSLFHRCLTHTHTHKFVPSHNSQTQRLWEVFVCNVQAHYQKI